MMLQRRVTRALDSDDDRRAAGVTAQFHAICQGLASCEINGVWRAMQVKDPERMWQETLAGYVGSLAIAG
jgi:hypothetical protein